MQEAKAHKPRAHERRKARRALVQAVYQWQMSQTSTVVLRDEFQDSGALARADRPFFDDVLGRVTGQAAALDAAFSGFLDRELKALDQVELAIMRLGTCELSERPDVPYRVVIDEYVELAKVFGAEQSYRYVNGVLDQVAARVRGAERGAADD